MGRKPKDWDLYALVALFEDKPDRSLTLRDLRRALHAERNPDRFNEAFNLIYRSGFFIFKPCDPGKPNDKKEIVYMPSYREAIERGYQSAPKDVVTPEGTGTKVSN